MSMGYENMVNDVEAYVANRLEAKQIEDELTRLICAKEAKDRTLQENLDIRNLRNKSIKLAKDLQEIEKRPMSTAQKLADKLHDTNCHRNHSDECGYYYEKSWNGDSHSQYLEQAQRIFDRIGEEESLRLLGLYDQKSNINSEIDKIISG